MKTIGPREAEVLMRSGGVDVVDVRDPREWASGHLPGARLVPLQELLVHPRSALPKDKVLLVCARGGRSQTAAVVAEKAGVAEVYCLDGGTEAWRRAGLAVWVPSATVFVSASVGQPVAHGKIATSVLRRCDSQRLFSADGRFSSRALAPPGEHGRVALYELWLGEGGREAVEAHGPGARGQLVVTAGQAEFDIDGRTHALAEGDAVWFAADAPWVCRNPAGDECRMVLVVSYSERSP